MVKDKRIVSELSIKDLNPRFLWFIWFLSFVWFVWSIRCVQLAFGSHVSSKESERGPGPKCHFSGRLRLVTTKHFHDPFVGVWTATNDGNCPLFLCRYLYAMALIEKPRS